MFTLKKCISSVTLLAMVYGTHSVANPWKYFTAAYWLPYTCGDAFNRKPKIFVNPERVPFFSQEVKKYDMDTFIRILATNDLRPLFNSQKDVEKEIARLKSVAPKTVFASAYWLPYTNGRQFDIDKLEEVKNSFQNNQ